MKVSTSNQGLQMSVFKWKTCWICWSRCIIAEEDHSGWHSFQKTKTIHTGSPKLDNRRLEKCWLVCCDIWIAGSEFVVNTMKVSILSYINGLGWWWFYKDRCTNWTLLKCHIYCCWPYLFVHESPGLNPIENRVQLTDLQQLWCYHGATHINIHTHISIFMVTLPLI